MKKFLFALLLLPMLSSAQKGMQFEHGKTWNEVLAKAKTENKYIFMMLSPPGVDRAGIWLQTFLPRIRLVRFSTKTSSI
jgi:hypothetical protein